MFKYLLLMIVSSISIPMLSVAHTVTIWTSIGHDDHNHNPNGAGPGESHSHGWVRRDVYVDFDSSNTSGSHPHIQDFSQRAFSSEFANMHDASATTEGGLQTSQIPRYFGEDEGSPPADTDPAGEDPVLPTLLPNQQEPHHEVIDPETGETFEFIPGVGLIPENPPVNENPSEPGVEFIPDEPNLVAKKSKYSLEPSPVTKGVPQADQEDQNIENLFESLRKGVQPSIQSPPAVSTRAHGFQPLRVTEYMVRNIVPGMGAFPQWIELYNPNSIDINIAGWHLTTVSFKKGKKFLTTLTIGSFVVPAGEASLFVTRLVPERFWGGIDASRILVLGIDNVLRSGWMLTDPIGTQIHQIGTLLGSYQEPVMPPRVGNARVSHSLEPAPAVFGYYYGHVMDVGSPGYHAEPVPAAPMAPKRTKIGMWVDLKNNR